jgi:hypothetical protein
MSFGAISRASSPVKQHPTSMNMCPEKTRIVKLLFGSLLMNSECVITELYAVA